MNAWLESHYPVHVKEISGRGRSVLASRALPAGTVVMACSAAAAYPSAGALACSTCFDSRSPLRRCASCKAVAYCSQGCQRGDWRQHRGECAHQSWLWSAQGEPGTEPVGGAADGSTLMLLSRLHRGLCLRLEEDAGSEAAMEATGVYVHTLADVGALASRPRAEVPALAAHLERAIEVAGRQGLWIPMGGGKGAAAPASLASLLRTALAFDVNDFCVTDDLFVPRAAGVYPMGALLNHSCAPNCCAVYVTPGDAAKSLRGGSEDAGALAAAVAAAQGLPGCALTPSVLVFRTLAPVAEGEELCHSYVDLALPRKARAEYLLGSYGFTCKCGACGSGAQGGGGGVLDTDAFLLGRASDDFLPTRNGSGSTPWAQAAASAAAVGGGGTASEERRVWPDLPPRVYIGVPQTASVEGGSGGSGIHNDFAGIPSPLKRELLTCQELLEAGRFSERPNGKNALSLFPLKLDAEALWRVRKAATGHRGASSTALDFPALGTDTALSLGREAWALENALTRLRPLLHPFHLQVHTTVSAAFEKYVAMNDLPAAASACEHLCAFYRAVYSSVCPAHPMLALQLFPLGDTYARLAALAQAEEAAGRPPSGGEPPASGGGGEAMGTGARGGRGGAELWRPSSARIVFLQGLFVQSAPSGAPTATGTCPVSHPFPANPDEAPGAAAARWRALAVDRYTECTALLAIAYGSTHKLTEQARLLAASGGLPPQ